MQKNSSKGPEIIQNHTKTVEKLCGCMLWAMATRLTGRPKALRAPFEEGAVLEQQLWQAWGVIQARKALDEGSL